MYVGADEIWYDGMNSDCLRRDDYDADEDGFVPDAWAAYSTLPAGDCDDARAAVHPGAFEWCDGADDDCDGLVDEGSPPSGGDCSGARSLYAEP